MSYIPPRPRSTELLAELRRIQTLQARDAAPDLRDVEAHVIPPHPGFPAAVHAAGHVVVADALSISVEWEEAGQGCAGTGEPVLEPTRSDHQDAAERYAIALLAGWAAEIVILGEASWRCRADLDQARRWIAKSIRVPGCRQVGDHAFELFEHRLQQRAIAIVRLKRGDVERIADRSLNRTPAMLGGDS